MAVLCIVFAAGLAALTALLVRYEKQLSEWAHILEETDENSNLRLGTSVRSPSFVRLARSVNKRLEDGQRARVRQEAMGRELKYTISCVSHDIRTPLTGAAGYLQLLEGCRDEKKQREYLSVIRRRLNNLEELLEELFLYTKLSDEEYHIECEEIFPFPVLCDTLAGFYDRLTKAGMEPVLYFPGMEDGTGETAVPASRQALERIFRNLIQNALLYGSGALTIRQEGVRISFTNPVEDAEGLDTERLFERFYRSDPSRHKGGTGLGLASVRGLMEKMGGTAAAQLKKNELTITLIFQK